MVGATAATNQTHMPQDENIGALIRERFAKLPKVVQDAITSVDVSNQMRELAKTHQLHLDQWDLLENEVHLALLGIQPLENLPGNLKREVGTDEATAVALAEDISRIVFEPIRQELERQLEHPEATAEKTTGVEDMRTRILKEAAGEVTTPPVPAVSVPVVSAPPTPPVPAKAVTIPVISAPTDTRATPENPPATKQSPQAIEMPAEPAKKVERTPVAAPSYVAPVPSHERKAIEGDPYREQLG